MSRRGGLLPCLMLAALTAACSAEAPTAGPAYGSAAQDGESSSRAERVVTLAPHLAELVFAAGAGDTLVGVSAYTDYPAAAAQLPQVGDAFGVDQERLRLLEPDLVLAWASGMPAHTVDELRSTGLPIVTIRTGSLEDVARAVEEIGRLTGNAASAETEAARFRAGIAALHDKYADRTPLRVFYQISARPLYTINGTHFISELIALCGGVNVFADLDELAPQVDVEAVVARDPDAIVGGTNDYEVWERFNTLAANRYGNRLRVDTPALARASTRLDAAGAALCEILDEARANRRQRSDGSD
ncbi:MAG: cobalamin-binding protein [Pseudomonadota bacterium]